MTTLMNTTMVKIMNIHHNMADPNFKLVKADKLDLESLIRSMR